MPLLDAGVAPLIWWDVKVVKRLDWVKQELVVGNANLTCHHSFLHQKQGVKLSPHFAGNVLKNWMPCV